MLQSALHAAHAIELGRRRDKVLDAKTLDGILAPSRAKRSELPPRPPR